MYVFNSSWREEVMRPQKLNPADRNAALHRNPRQRSHFMDTMRSLKNAIRSDKKGPKSVSELQRRLEYLERKMENINLQDSSISFKSDWEEQHCLKNYSPAVFLSDQKARINNRIMQKPWVKKSANCNIKQRKKSKDDLQTQKKNKPQRHESVSILQQLGKIKFLNSESQSQPKRIRQSQQQSKSINHKNVNLADAFSKQEAERTLNFSNRSLSQYSGKQAKRLKIQQQRKKLKKIEKELIRFQKQNKILKGKLNLFENIQLIAKKLKAATQQKIEPSRKQLKDSASKGPTSALICKGPGKRSVVC